MIYLFIGGKRETATVSERLKLSTPNICFSRIIYVQLQRGITSNTYISTHNGRAEKDRVRERKKIKVVKIIILRKTILTSGKVSSESKVWKGTKDATSLGNL